MDTDSKTTTYKSNVAVLVKPQVLRRFALDELEEALKGEIFLVGQLLIRPLLVDDHREPVDLVRAPLEVIMETVIDIGADVIE